METSVLNFKLTVREAKIIVNLFRKFMKYSGWELTEKLLCDTNSIIDRLESNYSDPSILRLSACNRRKCDACSIEVRRDCISASYKIIDKIHNSV
jgi:hypothetical protein